MKFVAVVGATGYVGARLVPLLLRKGYKVRAIARSYDKLNNRAFARDGQVELISCDVTNCQLLTEALRDVDVVYYFVHSMGPNAKDFATTDRLAAANMVESSKQAKVKRIIYLGGLGEDNSQLSKHLRSRAEVAQILQAGSVAVTHLRAAMIIGSGSASFEILRYLVDRLPVMITPKWVDTPCQPIAIRNVLGYLLGCLEQDETAGQTFDIGGPDILTYKRLMEIYAEEAGLARRLVIGVPFFTPTLSSYWIHLVTPVPAYIARPLAAGLCNPVVCQDTRIVKIIPQELLSLREAISLALDRISEQNVESHWTDAGEIPPAELSTRFDAKWAGGTVFGDTRRLVVKAKPAELWQPIVRLGGTTGWYYGNWLWRLRGVIDKLVGGVGLRRGRRHESQLAVGDALDFWRVVAVETDKRLMLVAEMKLPGQALLEFRLRRIDEDKTELLQSARFLPSGLAGILYWLAVSPLHELIFNGMLMGIAEASGKEIVSGPESYKYEPMP